MAEHTERIFMRQVIDLAKFHGWKVAHFGASVRIVGKERRFVGDRDSAGFPDLVLVREDRLIFAELKSDIGRLSPTQLAWTTALSLHPGTELYIWRPKNWQHIEGILK